MKVFFTAYGYRDVTNWECPNCRNFWASGMDLSVEESRTRHLAECTAKAEFKYDLDGQKIAEALDMRVGEAITTETVIKAIKLLINKPQFGQHCVCRWENHRVTSLCGAHYSVVHREIEAWKIDATKDLYKIIPTSCRCGGSWAWVRFNENGAQEMIGCVCHTVFIGGKPINVLA